MQTETNERIQERLVREEQEDTKDAYSPNMSGAEIEALIARLDRNSEERERAQTRMTDSVKSIRKMRTERTKSLRRLSGDADRR